MPDFEPPVPILLSTGDTIETEFSSSPFMADWNEDGLADLFTGEVFENDIKPFGKVRLYLNEGSPSSPVFTNFEYLQADDSVIVVSACYWWRSSHNGSDNFVRGNYIAIRPQVVDWNGDGKKDLLIGDTEGNVNYYRRLSDGTLTVMNPIGTPGEQNRLLAPVVTDWNSDGLSDLVIGVTEYASYDGVIHIFLNIGTTTDPVLDNYSTLLCNGDTIAHGNIWPDVADLNLDGLKDIILTEHCDSVMYYENSGSPGNPVFKSVETVDVAITLHHDLNVCVYDWDNNGTPDLLFGECYPGYIYRMMNKTPVEIKVNKPFAGYNIPKNIRVSVFDIKGRIMGSFDKQDNVPNGVYYIKVFTGNNSFVRKIIIMK